MEAKPIPHIGRTIDILSDVNHERRRQERLCVEGKFPYTCANPAISNTPKLAVLAEEFGEVARHIAEECIDPERLNPLELKKELIQVAAVAVAWAESL